MRGLFGHMAGSSGVLFKLFGVIRGRLNGSFRVCTVHGGLGVGPGSSFLKTGPVVCWPRWFVLTCGRSGHAQIGTFTINLCRTLWLPRVRVYQHSVQGL